MAIGIMLLVIGIVVDIFIVKWERKESKTPFIPEWKFDEDVTGADEVRAADLLEKYGKIDPMTLANTFILSQSIKEVVEQYATLPDLQYSLLCYRREKHLNTH